MSKLYEISGEYLALMDAIENEEIPSEAIADTVEGIRGEFEEKADNIACLIKNLRSDVDGMKAEENALSERRKSKEKQVESLTDYLSRNMQKCNVFKIETARNKLSFRKSTALVIENEADFISRNADLCRKETFAIPKKLVTDLIKSGTEMPGAHLEEHQNLQLK